MVESWLNSKFFLARNEIESGTVGEQVMKSCDSFIKTSCEVNFVQMADQNSPEVLLRMETYDDVLDVVQTNNFSRSSTFAEESKLVKSKTNKKPERNLTSQSTGSRSEAVNPSEPQTSLTPSTSSNRDPVNLPHALGSIPKYLQNKKSPADGPRSHTAVATVPLASSGTKTRLQSAPSKVESKPASVKPSESQTSLTSSISSFKGSVKTSKLPHAPGSLPKYLNKGKPPADGPRSRTAVATVPLASSGTKTRLQSPPSHEESIVFDEKDENAEKQKLRLKASQTKLREAQFKIQQLTESVENYKKRLEEAENKIAWKTKELDEKLDKDDTAKNKTTKLQREIRKASDQVKGLEEKLNSRESECNRLKQEIKSLTEELVNGKSGQF